jgi:hypothetical protein
VTERLDPDGVAGFDAALDAPMLTARQQSHVAQRRRRLAVAAMGGEVR